jgi:hypothetical protein
MAATDESAAEERWCEERRAEVTRYLAREGVNHGRIGEWPAWHLAPYVSIWAIESSKTPDSVGWWVICGDLPTDYVSAEGAKNPRDAMRTIAESWREQADLMAHGKSRPDIRIGQPEEWPSLSPLLKSRAATLLAWANDDAVWRDDAR